MLKETVTVIYLLLYTVTPFNFFQKLDILWWILGWG